MWKFFRDLAEISSRPRRESWRDRGAFLAAEISLSRRDLGTAPRSRPILRRDIEARSRRDHGEIREISAAKNAPRSRRDSRRDRSEIWKSRRANTRRDVAARSRRDREISVAKTRRDREVISRRDMEISAGSFAARSRWESCRDSRRETKFLAVKIFLLPRREVKFPAAKIGSMRTNLHLR